MAISTNVATGFIDEQNLVYGARLHGGAQVDGLRLGFKRQHEHVSVFRTACDQDVISRVQQGRQVAGVRFVQHLEDVLGVERVLINGAAVGANQQAVQVDAGQGGLGVFEIRGEGATQRPVRAAHRLACGGDEQDARRNGSAHGRLVARVRALCGGEKGAINVAGDETDGATRGRGGRGRRLIRLIASVLGGGMEARARGGSVGVKWSGSDKCGGDERHVRQGDGRSE